MGEGSSRGWQHVACQVLCDKAVYRAKVEELIEESAGEGLGQDGLTDDQQLSGGGVPAHRNGGEEE